MIEGHREIENTLNHIKCVFIYVILSTFYKANMGWVLQELTLS